MIKIQLLGIGAAVLKTDNGNIYLDAFNEFNQPPSLSAGDLVLFSHNDRDHFDAGKTLCAVEKSRNSIIGPPGIAYPLLAGGKLNANDLQVAYPGKISEPADLAISGIRIKIYPTRHFNGWEPDHISFLLFIGGKKIYFAGDSWVYPENDPDFKNLDAMIINMVDGGFLFGTTDEKTSIFCLMWELEFLRDKYKPGKLLCSHLIDFAGTVSPEGLKSAVREKGWSDVVVPALPEEEIVL